MTRDLDSLSPHVTEDIITIGQRIRAARKTRNLNQEALANRLGVTQPTVANWEADVHSPRQMMLARLAEALDVSLGWLAGGETVTPGAGTNAGHGYLNRGMYHVPVLPLAQLTGRDRLSDRTTRAAAIDYIPISARDGDYFATFLTPAPYEDVFPGEALFVFDARRIAMVPGCYALIVGPAGPHLHYWPASAQTGAPSKALGEVLGTLAVTVRFF
ncbi:helix-turn-helix transcriptional regulator [Parvularcula sp. LCG005]|uniref:helix-turn-helix domain-containing protein n=1 Tax=Parvularcula sp. LCG005 TaxID=3078805 RepID=UPI0029425A61|nr:helix-turn-helix transcriptional regulator [Parvularcula sp. LCG005]WOI52549.1 helix-turn-helix transcriptional regulator [Parvularcula sp. LCG005]